LLKTKWLGTRDCERAWNELDGASELSMVK